MDVLSWMFFLCCKFLTMMISILLTHEASEASFYTCTYNRNN